MKRYEGKKVVIIGGTSGMGLATAKMLLDGGSRVLVTGRSKEGLESAQNEIGNDAVVVSSDARSLTDIDALASKVKAEFDTFDLLFVNAGFSIRAPLENMTEAIYDEMFNLNTKGPLFAVQKLTPLINRGGSVVFTTSIANQSYGAIEVFAARTRLRFDRHSISDCQDIPGESVAYFALADRARMNAWAMISERETSSSKEMRGTSAATALRSSIARGGLTGEVRNHIPVRSIGQISA